jgi:hypothetical protein
MLECIIGLPVLSVCFPSVWLAFIKFFRVHTAPALSSISVPQAFMLHLQWNEGWLWLFGLRCAESGLVFEIHSMCPRTTQISSCFLSMLFEVVLAQLQIGLSRVPSTSQLLCIRYEDQLLTAAAGRRAQDGWISRQAGGAWSASQGVKACVVGSCWTRCCPWHTIHKRVAVPWLNHCMK